MNRQQFRLVKPTLALAIVGGQQIPTQIPKQALLSAPIDQLFEARFVDVSWKGKRLTMFAQDLRERGEPVPG